MVHAVPSTSKVLRSLLTPDAVADLARESYALNVTGCTLIRTFVNDVYEVATPDCRYVLKLYHHGGWSPEEVAWEVELVTHLAAEGVEVAHAVPLANGEPAGVLNAVEGFRPYALSEYVEGSKPQQPYTDELYHTYGRLLARFHQAADGFRTSLYRRPFGLDLALDEPLDQIRPALADQPEDLALARKLGEEARAQITGLAEKGLAWGIQHGDVTLDNIHVANDGRLILHDFDLTAEGWRAADLTSCLSTPFADAFREGYTEIGTLTEADLAALPWLRAVEVIANLRFHLVDKPAWRGTESLTEGWLDGCLSSLRSTAAELLQP